jgi:alanine racemase
MIATVQISILKDCSRFLRKSKAIFKKNSYSIGFFQSGLSTEELYSKVAQLVVSNKPRNWDRETISQFKDEFVNCITFQTTVDFVAYFDTLDFSNETILIKGARLFQFEEMCTCLRRKRMKRCLKST